jgi:hypothetical protein
MKTLSNGKMSHGEMAILQSAIEHLLGRGFENIIILSTKKNPATGKNNGFVFGRKRPDATSRLLAMRLGEEWLDTFSPEESPLHGMWYFFSKAMRLEIDILRGTGVNDAGDVPSRQK